MSPSEKSAIAVNDLFTIMFGLFPSTYSIFKNREDLDDCKRAWWKGLVQREMVDKNGDLDYEFIKRGVNKLYYLKQPFMPSFGEFIALCFPPEEISVDFAYE